MFFKILFVRTLKCQKGVTENYLNLKTRHKFIMTRRFKFNKVLFNSQFVIFLFQVVASTSKFSSGQFTAKIMSFKNH